MKELEKQYKALANRRRLAILKYLKRRKSASVSEIANYIKLSLKATSKHLAVLYAVDAVEKEQKGLSAIYSLAVVQKSVIKHALTFI
ncbi:MAG: winged helix-turn-helix transcriptional regulator [Candidatus Kerfeldbacteria bacterium]|nr:winged helix-turn-helix transcriptional regulator [Candidatus Kerfeldbacteria bacterium]